MTNAAAAVAAAALSGIAVAALRRFDTYLPRAHPTERSLHDRPIPRVGGLAIWVGALPIACVAPPAGIATMAWLAGVLAVAVVSAIDDWRGVAPIVRLAAHLAGAAIVVAAIATAAGASAAGTSDLPRLVATALAIVWASNLYNFMDGSDGLAAAMTILGFGACGIAAAMSGAPSAAFFAVSGASAAFLFVNAPPARMFMGDVGAVPLGFLAAAWGIAGTRGGVYPDWFVPLVFLPFWADATVTLARRIARGERVWQAHRSHYYQRLHQLGAGHRGTLLFFGVLMAGTAVSSLYVLALAPARGWTLFGSWVAIHAALFAAIDYHWRKRCLPTR